MEIQITRCDGCGEETNRKDPPNWFTVTIKVNGQTGQGEAIHVDSWDCLGRYAQRKAKEQEPSM